MKAFNDIYATPGAFSWSELMCKDPAQAAEFYARLFGWTVETMPMPGDPENSYRVLKVGEVAVAGLMGVSTGMHQNAREASQSTRLAQRKLDELMKRFNS